MGKLIKVTVNLPEVDVAALRYTAAATERSMTETLRRAIGLLTFLARNQRAGGCYYIERDCGCISAPAYLP